MKQITYTEACRMAKEHGFFNDKYDFECSLRLLSLVPERIEFVDDGFFERNPHLPKWYKHAFDWANKLNNKKTVF